MDDRIAGTNSREGQASDAPEAPLAMLFCSDLMFAIQLQKMARKTGYRVSIFRPGIDIHPATVLLVNVADRGDWEAIIREAREGGIEVIAFGPHMDTEARRKAKAAGAARVLANSNLERDLPGILIGIRNSPNTLHDMAHGAEG